MKRTAMKEEKEKKAFTPVLSPLPSLMKALQRGLKVNKRNLPKDQITPTCIERPNSLRGLNG